MKGSIRRMVSWFMVLVLVVLASSVAAAAGGREDCERVKDLAVGLSYLAQAARGERIFVTPRGKGYEGAMLFDVKLRGKEKAMEMLGFPRVEALRSVLTREYRVNANLTWRSIILDMCRMAERYPGEFLYSLGFGGLAEPGWSLFEVAPRMVKGLRVDLSRERFGELKERVDCPGAALSFLMAFNRGYHDPEVRPLAMRWLAAVVKQDVGMLRWVIRSTVKVYVARTEATMSGRGGSWPSSLAGAMHPLVLALYKGVMDAGDEGARESSLRYLEATLKGLAPDPGKVEGMCGAELARELRRFYGR